MASKQNTLGPTSGIDNKNGMVNVLDSPLTNGNGIPTRQSQGIGDGRKENSMNQLPSNAEVIYPAKSNLMTGMSMNRGPGGK